MIIIFNYHYVREKFNYNHDGIKGTSVENFKIHLDYLSRNINFISSKDLLSKFSDDLFNNDEINVLITFDDGLREQYLNCLPILEKNNIPALFFINTAPIYENIINKVQLFHYILSNNNHDSIYRDIKNYIRQNRINLKFNISNENINNPIKYGSDTFKEIKFLFNYSLDNDNAFKLINHLYEKYYNVSYDNYFKQLYMTKDQVNNLSYKSFLGSHGHNHINYGLSTLDETNQDIMKSKAYLDKYINKTINIFSYPFGTKNSFNKSVVNLLKKNGFEYGFTIERAYNNNFSNKMFLSRFDCNDLDSLIKKNVNLTDLKKIYNHSNWTI